MARGFELLEDGTHPAVEVKKESLQSTKVFCVVDNSTHSVYLWKGSQSGMRKQLAGALAATEIRLECGERFKVQAIDQGEEPPGFLSLFEVETV
ncbi:MAG: hypothetical protein C4K47_09305 [Candidatus Thorarchaeota archaeon]|nr:MAG: hypothetical protein C4K47_09305 [Candidatus Thorarchaeota archaeon]